MMGTQVYVDGVLRQFWDDTARVYRLFDAQGAQIDSRPYNAVENARADADAAMLLAEQNQRTIEEALATSLAGLQAIIDDTNTNINGNPAQRIKDLARAQRRLIRLVIRRFDGTT